MKIKQIVAEAIKRPSGAGDRAVQYISGPMLPMVDGNYRFQDVLKRVKELKDAVAQAKQRGKLDINSQAYKNIIAELQKWDQWLQDSQAPAQPGTPTINIEEETGSDWQPVASRVGSDPNDVIPEVPADFNPGIALRKINLLTKELRRMQGLKYEERAKIVAEIRKLENQNSLYTAQIQSQPGYRPTPVEPDEGAPYTKYTRENGGTGQPFAKTREGAIRGAKQDIMQQKAIDYIIVTDNNHEVVYSWSHYPNNDLPRVGDTYQTQRLNNRWQDSNQPRYPAGHPHAGAVMPPKV